MPDQNRPEKQNAASRIERFVHMAMSNKQDASALDALAHALGLPDDVQGLDRQHQVADLITGVITELRSMKARLLAVGIPVDLVESYASKAEQALAVGNFNNPWKTTISNFLSADVLLSLKWYAHVLPEDDVTSTPEEVAELSRLISELAEAVARPGIPVSLAQFLDKQISAIRIAVRLFPVAGVAPIRAAARALIVDIRLDDDEIRAAVQQGDPKTMNDLGTKLKKAWDKSVQIAGDVEKFGKAGKAVLEVSEFFSKLLSHT